MLGTIFLDPMSARVHLSGQSVWGDGFLTCQGAVDQDDSSPLIQSVSAPVLLRGDVRVSVLGGPDGVKEVGDL